MTNPHAPPEADGGAPAWAEGRHGGVEAGPSWLTLDVPSGRVVFANDLRDLVVTHDACGLDEGGPAGWAKVTRAYAATGMLHVFVGNTCPGVRRRGRVIEVVSGRPPRGGRRLGTVTTDLWWVSAMDRDHFLRRCRVESRDPDDFGTFEVSVGPGTYAFSCDHVDRQDGGRGHVLCTIRPAPVRVPLVEVTRGRDLPFADSHFAGFRHGLDFAGSPGFLSYVLHVAGNGLSWVDGVPSEQTRAEDVAFATLEGRSAYGHPRAVEVPGLSGHVGLRGFGEDFVPEVGVLMPPLVGRMPLGVDAEWLAAALVVTRSVIGCDDPTSSPGRDARAVRASHEVVLDVLCELGEARGLWDGALQALFPLVVGHVGRLRPGAGTALAL